MKNRILLETYYLPGELKQHLQVFVDSYNHKRYHALLDNLTPADVLYGRADAVLERRKQIRKCPR